MTLQSQLDQVLAPCPFCGSADVRVFGDKPDESMIGGYNVICGNPNCQSTCRHSGDRDKAIAAWNKRAAVGGEAVAVGRVQRAGLGYYAMLLPGVEPPQIKEGDCLYTRPFPPATVDVGALRRALTEYPDKNPQQSQAHKVCAGVLKLAASYAGEER